MINDSKQKGFTLLEVIITSVIASFILGAIGTFLVMGTKSYTTSKDIVELQYQAQVTVNNIIDTIMYSEGVKVVRDEEALPGVKGLQVNLNKVQGKYGYYIVDTTVKNLYYIQDQVAGVDGGMPVPRTLKEVWEEYQLDDVQKQQKYLMTKSMEDIIFSPDELGETGSIQITLVLVNNTKELKVSNQVRAKNYIAPPVPSSDIQGVETDR